MADNPYRSLFLGVALALLAFAGCATRSAAPADRNAPGHPVGPSTEEALPEVSIHGVEGALLENVQAHLSLKEETCGAPLWRVQRRYQQAPTEIGQGLRALGYYEPTIEKRLFLSCSTLETFGKDEAREDGREDGRKNCTKGCWSADFSIDPGAPVRVGQIDIVFHGEAGEDPAFRALREAPPIQVGDVLDHGRYEGLKDDIADLAADLGFFDGRFTAHELQVDTEQRRAAIRIVYDSGPRYRFGPLRIHQEGLEDEMIERIIDWQEGNPFETDKLTVMHRELADSGFFSSVSVRPQREEAGKDLGIPVDVDLTLRKRYRFSFGLGATTDGGPSGSFGVVNRRINTRGHQWLSDTAISVVASSIGAEYRIPLADPRTDWLSLRGGYKREDTDTTKSQSLAFGARYTRRYAGDWLGNLSLEALQEDFRSGEEDESAMLIVAGMGFSRSHYDDPIRPRRGHSLDLKLHVSDTMFGSDSRFIQGHVSGRWVRGAPWGDGRFISRGELGASWVDEFDELPNSYRFFAGGDKSVRGYAFHELGPRDDTDEVIGGPHILVGSLEYEHPITAKWALSTFVDHGNALDNSVNLFSSHMKTSTGFGVRWFSPFGPAGVDLAFPLGEDGSPFRIHLNVGVDL